MITLNKIKVKLNFIKVLSDEQIKRCDTGTDYADDGKTLQRSCPSDALQMFNTRLLIGKTLHDFYKIHEKMLRRLKRVAFFLINSV